MAKKTNYEKNGNNYFRTTATIGRTSDGKVIRKEFYGKSKREAEEKKNEYMQKINSGLTHDHDKIVVGTLMHAWLFEVLHPSEMKPSTFDKYEGLYRNYIKDDPVHIIRVSDIRTITIQQYYNRMYEQGITPKTIFNVHKLLRFFFNYCVAQDYLLKNPCFKLTIPGKIEEKRRAEMHPYTNEEITSFSDALKGNKIEMLILLTLGTGLREGELLGLSFEDIDLDKKELHVRKHLKLVKIIKKDGTHEYKRILQMPKTKNSLRTVPIPSKLIFPLKQYIVIQKEKLIKNGLSYTPEKLVFTTQTCECMDSANLLRAWTRLQKKAKVDYRHFHTLRHTYATKLFENGVPLKTVSMLLGHSNISITADTYTHVMPKEKTTAADTLNSLFV